MKPLRFVLPVLAILAIVGVGGVGLTVWYWPAKSAQPAPHEPIAESPTESVVVSESAQRLLGITEPIRLAPSPIWRTITVPGIIVDRPGTSDRGVAAPITGIVTTIHHFPGDTVSANEPLFTLRVVSESFHSTQADLFKSTEDIRLARAQRKRLADAGSTASEARILEVDTQLARLDVAARSARAELQTRGMSPTQIEAISKGEFVREIPVVAPDRPGTPEVQELRCELGQQVSAGQVLCILADHRSLAIEGRAFRDETPLIEKAAENSWPVAVDFQEPAGSDWPATMRTFHIRRLASTIDPGLRTFAFILPLDNESRTVKADGKDLILWRYRPGQKVRLRVPVAEVTGQFVLPVEAVAREGGEAFVFVQNVNTFERVPVRVLFAEAGQVVVVNDGAVSAGVYVARTAAGQLNRMVKSGGAAGGVPKGYHMHADGSLHKNGEPE